MKQHEIFKKIGVILKELSDQYEYLEAEEDHFNELELELFVANVNFLTDHIEILYKLNLQNNNSQQNSDSNEQKYFEPVVQSLNNNQNNIEEISSDQNYTAEIESNAVLEESSVSKPEIEHESVLESKSPGWENPEFSKTVEVLDEAQNSYLENEKQFDEIFSNIKPAIQEAETSQISTNSFTEAYHETSPLEAFSPSTAVEEKPFTLNQQISVQSTELADQPSGPPISDIKQGITLNDKLLYVKELFNGYNLAYAEAVEILNRFSTFDEALKFLNTNYVTKNNWAGKPETTEKFYALLKRRYA